MNFLSVLYAKAGITVDGVTTLNNTATGLTPATNDNSTKLATTGYVKNQNYYPYPTGTTAQYVRGDGSLATFPGLTGYVPYTGATANVDLGSHSLTASDLVINHASGSGVASRPSQSPRDENNMEFQSFRNAGIAKTPRVSSCAGAAGLGREDMGAILSKALTGLIEPI